MKQQGIASGQQFFINIQFFIINLWVGFLNKEIIAATPEK